MRILVVTAVLAAAACSRTTPEGALPPAPATVAVHEPPVAPEVVPEGTAPLVARADAAIAELQATLGKRLAAGLAESGPAGAVEVCAGAAQGLTAEVGERHGVTIGRTSARLRNGRNAPRPWVKDWLDRQQGRMASDATPAVRDLGDRVGVIRPIAVAPGCLACHGAPERIDAGTRALLGERYPGDAAVGYAEGQLRGAFWVEVPRLAAAPAAEDEGGPADD